MVSRRELTGNGRAGGRLDGNAQAQSAPSIARMGGTPTAFSVRSRRGGKPFDIVEHCHNIGLGGVQTNPPSLEPDAIKKFRERLEAYDMHLSCDPRLPRQESELPAFEAQVKAYKEAGAHSFHAAMTGRRYEEYDSLTPWKTMFEQAQKTIERAEPILRKYKMQLGIENHKGWRSAEQAAWLKRLGSEYVGRLLRFRQQSLALRRSHGQRAESSLPTPSPPTSRTWAWRSMRTASCSPKSRWARAWSI